MAELEHVLRVEPTPQLLGQVGRILGAGVEREQTVQVRKHRGAQIACALGIGQSVQPRQRLRGEDHIGTVLGQLAEHLFVIGARDAVELVDDQRHWFARRRRQQRLGRDRAGGQVQQRAADERGQILADIERVQVDDDEFPSRDELAESDRRAGLPTI